VPAAPSASDRRVHVLHVVPTLGVGGLELTMARVISELGKRGMQHSIVCLKGEAAIRDRFGDVVRIHCMNAGVNDLSLPWRLRKLIREIRPTVIHARNWGAWPDVALARLTVWPRVPLVFSFHGVDSPGPMPLRRRLAFRILAHFTTRLFTVSEASRRKLAEETGVPESRIGVIPNGVDTDRFAPALPKPEVGRFVVGSVGSLTAVKNHALLVRACGEVLRRGTDIELRIAGEGPERARLTEMAASLGMADRLRLSGLVGDVPAFLHELDVFVLSSSTEAHPNALLEAMACGLPCVATRVGGSPEVLEEGRSGILVEAEDPPALAEAVGRLAADRGERDRLGQAGRRRACDHYNMDRMLVSYEALYTELAAAKGGGAKTEA